jgi:hypothetical protein
MSGRRLAEKKRVASIQYKTLMAPGKKCYLIAHQCTPECSFIGRSAAEETAYASIEPRRRELLFHGFDDFGGGDGPGTREPL